MLIYMGKSANVSLSIKAQPCIGVGPFVRRGAGRAAHGEEDAKGVAFFESRIRPVLVEKCQECHSSQAKKLKGGLKVDSRASIRAGGIPGPPLFPAILRAASFTRQSPAPAGSSRCPPRASSPARLSPISASGSPLVHPTRATGQNTNQPLPPRRPTAANGGHSSHSGVQRSPPLNRQCDTGPKTRSTPSFSPRSRTRTSSRPRRPSAVP